jgi:hypothetical protein
MFDFIKRRLARARIARNPIAMKAKPLRNQNPWRGAPCWGHVFTCEAFDILDCFFQKAPPAYTPTNPSVYFPSILDRAPLRGSTTNMCAKVEISPLAGVT